MSIQRKYQLNSRKFFQHFSYEMIKTTKWINFRNGKTKIRGIFSMGYWYFCTSLTFNLALLVPLPPKVVTKFLDNPLVPQSNLPIRSDCKQHHLRRSLLYIRFCFSVFYKLNNHAKKKSDVIEGFFQSNALTFSTVTSHWIFLDENKQLLQK